MCQEACVAPIGLEDCPRFSGKSIDICPKKYTGELACALCKWAAVRKKEFQISVYEKDY
jgi:hypothetical protein